MDDVVAYTAAGLCGDDLRGSVDGDDPLPDLQGHVVGGVPVVWRERELIHGLPGEAVGQMHAVVGGPRLLAEANDVEAPLGVARPQPFAEAMPDHAVADDDRAQSRHPPLARHPAIRFASAPNRDPLWRLNRRTRRIEGSNPGAAPR